jgi:hypothetical protein
MRVLAGSFEFGELDVLAFALGGKVGGGSRMSRISRPSGSSMRSSWRTSRVQRWSRSAMAQWSALMLAWWSRSA